MQHNHDRDGYHSLISRLTGTKSKNTADIRKLNCIPDGLKKIDLRRLDDLKAIVDYLEQQSNKGDKKMVKHRTEVYTKYHAWTSYNNLSLEQTKAIQDSCFVCYDEIPEQIETHLGIVELYKLGEFLPIIEAYENPGKIWSHNRKSDWYTHVATGVKVKKTVVKSNNYDRPKGESHCTTTLTVKIPLPSERGKNPNSHNNRAIPGLISKDINLTEDQWQLVDALGKGKGYSQGIRNLLEKV
jgi:hypothetical protein